MTNDLDPLAIFLPPIPKRFFERLHRGMPGRIIETACFTLGLSLADLCPYLEEPITSFSDLDDISVTGWLRLCLCLQIEVDSISYGYCEYVHKKSIGEAIYKGENILPKTPEVQHIFKEYCKELKRDRKNTLKHYGKRLKRIVRLDHIHEDLQYFLKRKFKAKASASPTISMEYFS